MPSRRFFLQAAALSPLAFAQSGPSIPPERRVSLAGDGVVLAPPDYARLLSKIIDEHGAATDSYLAGGAVEQLEQTFAKLLGKERPCFCPPERWRIIWRCANWPRDAA
jgi:hypothetical protein